MLPNNTLTKQDSLGNKNSPTAVGDHVNSGTELDPEPSPRLYVGNFTDKVTEYTILKLFERHGKIASIDYLWHQEGPKHGMPRGYCFVEMGTKEDAGRAVAALNNKVVGGRPLSVAYSAARSAASEDDGLTGWQRRAAREAQAAAIASVNQRLQAKTGAAGSTESKIKALERKLSQIQQQQQAASSSSTSVNSLIQHTSTLTPRSTAPHKRHAAGRGSSQSSHRGGPDQNHLERSNRGSTGRGSSAFSDTSTGRSFRFNPLSKPK
ncbi:hypothetical protein BSLG_010594 [Batrachochytrium salamandrivorans]|nr:hypothetical protein BSLG_010594 [Batrachochytrium salamandrivorans]